ncbi:hypothetical protein [Paenibacillus sp. BC26]|uniref:hypothetical protein n=1 Tax=Paenibacillus sp. BC26 TaxID=1881032 RepID=UPI0008F112BD|nr:hypothetical protein [Paenibacillus sp. BC26]SFT09567.1 hypothetical protein SAMN05428962_4348 [Paenibacillus sp. BC26]
MLQKSILIVCMLALYAALVAGPVLFLVNGLYVYFLINCFISFVSFSWLVMSRKGRKRLKIGQRVLFIIFSLLFLIVGSKYLRDVPAYYSSDWRISEGYPLDVEYSRRGGADIKLQGVTATFGSPYLPSNPSNHKFRITYLPQSNFILKCEYDDDNAWETISACY